MDYSVFVYSLDYSLLVSSAFVSVKSALSVSIRVIGHQGLVFLYINKRAIY